MKNFPQLPAGARFSSGHMISGVKDGHDAFMKWDDFVRSITNDSLHTQSGGAGFDGIAEAHSVSIVRNGTGLIKTDVYLDITDLNSKATDLDIIGQTASGEAWFMQLTAARNGVIFKAIMHCLEIPAGGDPDIDLYEAVEATGIEDSIITDLDETVLLTSQGDATDWATGDDIDFATLPTADEYLYLVQGDATGTTGTYTGGIFWLEFWGFKA